jgi:hypothetical protein
MVGGFVTVGVNAGNAEKGHKRLDISGIYLYLVYRAICGHYAVATGKIPVGGHDPCGCDHPQVSQD